MQDLVYQSLAVLVATAGLALLYWALFRDRSRGRRRCPKCWYDLRGSKSLTCSECGYTAWRERQFYTTRRQWRYLVMLFVIGCASTALWHTPKVQRDGWHSVLPTSAVIIAMPYDPAASLTELKKRWLSELYRQEPQTLDGWEYKLAISRARRLLGPEHPIGQRTDMLEFILMLDRAQPVGDILLQWLNEPNVTIQSSAISLTDIAVLAPVGDRAIAERVYELRQGADGQFTLSATKALGRFVNDDGRYVEVLLNGLSSKDLALSMRSAMALTNLNSPDDRVLRALCDMLRSGNHGAWIAADTLGGIGDGTVALHLAQTLRGADYSLSTGCAKALLRLGAAAQSADVTSVLVDCLENQDANVRGSAVAALTGQGSFAEPFLPDIISSLDERSTETAASIMIEAKLMGIDSPILAPMISAMVEVSTARIEQSTDCYETCEFLIGLMMWNPSDSEAFVPLLLRFIEGPSEALQQQAAMSLRFYGPRAISALPALQAALRQATTDDAKASIEDAISAISGKLPRI